MFDTIALGLRIRYYRYVKGHKQKDFANKLGTSQASLSKLENGRIQTINIKFLEKIADELGVTLDELLIDSLDKYKRNNQAKQILPKSLYYIKLLELLPNLTENQQQILSKYLQYILKDTF